MGMDVYGKSPKSEVGKYFRNNVWWWRPLWEYACDVASHLIDEKTARGGCHNDGVGLDDAKSIELARFLLSKVESGETAIYAKDREEKLAKLPDSPCECCGGTGKRLPPGLMGAGEQNCNACTTDSMKTPGTGRKPHWDTCYPFSVENVIEFSKFLMECGGFEIC